MTRSAASDRAVVLALIGLIVASVWFKSRVSPPVPPPPAGWLERAIAARLTAQGFATIQRRLPLGAVLIEGRRGGCALIARDARDALGAEAAFAGGMRGIGPVAYLYAGRSYPAPPILRIRIDRLQREAARLIGLHLPTHVPLALAAARPCGAGPFDLADIDLPD